MLSRLSSSYRLNIYQSIVPGVTYHCSAHYHARHARAVDEQELGGLDRRKCDGRWHSRTDWVLPLRLCSSPQRAPPPHLYHAALHATAPTYTTPHLPATPSTAPALPPPTTHPTARTAHYTAPHHTRRTPLLAAYCPRLPFHLLLPPPSLICRRAFVAAVTYRGSLFLFVDTSLPLRYISILYFPACAYDMSLPSSFSYFASSVGSAHLHFTASSLLVLSTLAFLTRAYGSVQASELTDTPWLPSRGCKRHLLF